MINDVPPTVITDASDELNPNAAETIIGTNARTTK